MESGKLDIAHDRFSFDQTIVDVAFHRFGSEDMPLTKEVPWPTNASVTNAEYDGKRFRLTDYSLDGFMGELLTKLPENV